MEPDRAPLKAPCATQTHDNNNNNYIIFIFIAMSVNHTECTLWTVTHSFRYRIPASVVQMFHSVKIPLPAHKPS